MYYHHGANGPKYNKFIHVRDERNNEENEDETVNDDLYHIRDDLYHPVQDY